MSGAIHIERGPIYNECEKSFIECEKDCIGLLSIIPNRANILGMINGDRDWRMKMDYETAIESFVSRQEAIDECARHGILADWDIDTAELFDCASGETIAFANQHGEYAGADVLAWLGY